MNTHIRIDIYLWAIRIYKSRSLANDAIKKNKVKLNELPVKSSHMVKLGERYTISFPQGIKKIIEVTGIIDKRQSYTIAKENYVDHSPQIDTSEKLHSVFFIPNPKREKGSGRPTKKDRRDMSDFRNE